MIIAGVFQSFWDGIRAGLQILIDWISTAVQAVWDAFVFLISFVFDAVGEVGRLLLESTLTGLVGLFPGEPNWAGIQATLDGINYFFPMAELTGGLVLLFGFQMTIFLAKVVLKLIPTVW